LLLVLLTVFLVYLPALNGGLLLDDDSHITKPELQSIGGLYRIWFEVGATYQYYPLLHSAFWFEHMLWNDSALGYHAVTLLWHMTSVVLLYLILTRLRIPGALLAVAIFALHPVMVESVAWMSEQKNTLSAVFCLSALLAYLKFDESRYGFYYFTALCLFVLGLLTKTVITATLPATLLVVFWWQRGSLSWKRDIRPLLPFLVVGAMGGFVTAWVERKLIGAEGVDFELTLLERGLVAGRVVWFYLSKLVWPTNLTFFYPRWDVNPKEWWQWLFPIATLGAFVGSWAMRRRSRAPLAAWLLFVGTLVPVLGFLNVYPFIFSFVADHFQYLASLGIIVPVSAAIATGLERASLPIRRAGAVLCILLVATLAVLTLQQSRMYADVVTLYRTTIERNPDSWAAHNNLGTILSAQNQQQEAIEHYRAAIRVRPDYVAAHTNLGTALAATGQLPEAFDHLHKAIELQPESVAAHRSLGNALANAGRHAEAIDEYQAALMLRPEDSLTLNSLGAALTTIGRLPQAIEHLQLAVRLNPASQEARANLGNALARSGNLLEGIAELQRAIELRPDDAGTLNNLGIALLQAGRFPEAIQQLRRAVQLSPTADAHNNLGTAFMQTGRLPEAIGEFQAALALKPDFAGALSNLGNVLTRVNRFPEAIEHLERAVQLQPDFTDAHISLGAALMYSGKIPQAIEQFTRAAQLNPSNFSAHYNLGILLAETGDVTDAMTHLKQAMQLRPNSAETHKSLGDLHQKNGNPNTAIDHYRAAIRLKPDFVEAYVNLAQSLNLTNQSDEAVATARKGIEIARSTGQDATAGQLREWLIHLQADSKGKVNAQPSPQSIRPASNP
jgi:tetratricopeptide (TPR) repeat protein